MFWHTATLFSAAPWQKATKSIPLFRLPVKWYDISTEVAIFDFTICLNNVLENRNPVFWRILAKSVPLSLPVKWYDISSSNI
jgi:hypothetical protein